MPNMASVSWFFVKSWILLKKIDLNYLDSRYEKFEPFLGNQRVAQLKIWTSSILVLALLHRTHFFYCDCISQRTKHFLKVLWRCATPRILKFFPLCATKIALRRKFFNFEDLQKQYICLISHKTAVTDGHFCPEWGKISIWAKIYSSIFEKGQKWGWIGSKF